MKSYAKAALGVLAALAAIGAVAPSPASAQEWRDREYHRHYRPHYYHPGYVYAPPPPVYVPPPPQPKQEQAHSPHPRLCCRAPQPPPCVQRRTNCFDSTKTSSVGCRTW